eukprot:94165-Rhodomonas_salina.2
MTARLTRASSATCGWRPRLQRRAHCGCRALRQAGARGRRVRRRERGLGARVRRGSEARCRLCSGCRSTPRAAPRPRGAPPAKDKKKSAPTPAAPAAVTAVRIESRCGSSHVIHAVGEAVRVAGEVQPARSRRSWPG